jgi:lipopolysaccharide export system ATP-binding protein
LDEINLDPLAPSARTSKGLGYLPQESWLFSDLTVKENLNLFGELKGLKAQNLKECVDRVLVEMKISHLENSIAARLSGGEKRRLEFARTLMFSPKILLLDEPFTGIDPKTVQEITKIIHSLKERNISIFISDHQAETILKLVDTVYIIYDGEIIAHGCPSEVKKNQQVQNIYLGSQSEI